MTVGSNAFALILPDLDHLFLIVQIPSFTQLFYRTMRYLLPFLLLVSIHLSAQNGDAPPNAQPGKCYAKCFIPDRYETVNQQLEIQKANMMAIPQPPELETVTENVVVKAAAQKLTPIAAVFDTVKEEVVVKEASKRYFTATAEWDTTGGKVRMKPGTQRNLTITAEYATVQEQYVIKPEHVRIVVDPPVWETVEEEYEIEPAYTKYKILEPQYQSVTDRAEIRPASLKWVRKKADANCLQANPDDCLVWCLVEIPAEYQVYTRKVYVGCPDSGQADNDCIVPIEVPAKKGKRTVQRLKSPAKAREEIVPAETRTITKRVVKTPPEEREKLPVEYQLVSGKVVAVPAPVRIEEVPAETITVTKYVLKSPASMRSEDIPAEIKPVQIKKLKPSVTSFVETPAQYIPLTKQVLVRPGGFTEWREVVCDEKITNYSIKEIQEALKKAGYDPGPPDGNMGGRTKAALLLFQQDKGLPVGNIDYETLKALGINL